jgi:hypothetical protein
VTPNHRGLAFGFGFGGGWYLLLLDLDFGIRSSGKRGLLS